MHDYDNGFYITKDGVIDLTCHQNEILKILIENKNRITNFEEIYEKLYLRKVEENEYLKKHNQIRVIIFNLNKKLKGKLHVKNKTKFGYYIVYKGE